MIVSENNEELRSKRRKRKRRDRFIALVIGVGILTAVFGVAYLSYDRFYFQNDSNVRIRFGNRTTILNRGGALKNIGVPSELTFSEQEQEEEARLPTPCRFDVERYLQRRHGQWKFKREPAMTAVTTVNGTQAVLFVTSHLGGRYRTYATANWTCNDNIRGFVKHRDGHQHVLLVQCPLPYLTSLSVTFPAPAKTVLYNTTLLSLCDLEIQVNEAPATLPTNTASPTIVACPMVKGNYQEILQWVEYHRLIGVQHFWIYINENLTQQQWHNDSILPKRPYISYIPFAYSFGRGHTRGPQQASENECLYRAKAYGVSWIGMQDVDEYFRVTIGSNRTTTTKEANKPELHRLIESIPNLTTYGGLQFSQVCYGRAPSQDTSDILLDYYGTTGKVEETGPKMLDQAMNVQFHSVHEITTGRPALILDPETQGYFHHYKLPHTGVGRHNDRHAPEDVKTDSNLRDGYATKVKQAIEKGNKRWNDPYSSIVNYTAP